MLKTIRVFFEKSNNIKKSTYFWNSLNATLSACQSAIILMVMTRTNGVYDAGVFSIAYAVGSLMLFIGQYGIRRFQASDINEQFSFSEYCGMRILTCAVMLLVSLGYCIYGGIFLGYTIDKFIVVYLICVLKAIQAFADVLHGRMQQKGRLDVAARASATRIILGTLTYMGFLIVTEELITSTVMCVLVSFVVFLLTSVNIARNYCSLKPSFAPSAMKGLTIAGFPIFLSFFLSMYVGNAPKYAIDAYLTEELQAYYNFIFMPAFAVQLLANFIFNPILTSYAQVWLNREYRKFKKLIRKQMLVVLGITCFGLLVSATIGIPMLSFIFDVDLSPYRLELCIIMLGGGMLAYVTFFTTVITIIRQQNTLLVGYISVALAAKLLSKFFVLNYGLIGAAVMYSSLMTLLAICFFGIMIFKIKHDEKR